MVKPELDGISVTIPIYPSIPYIFRSCQVSLPRLSLTVFCRFLTLAKIATFHSTLKFWRLFPCTIHKQIYLPSWWHACLSHYPLSPPYILTLMWRRVPKSSLESITELIFTHHPRRLTFHNTLVLMASWQNGDPTWLPIIPRAASFSHQRPPLSLIKGCEIFTTLIWVVIAGSTSSKRSLSGLLIDLSTANSRCLFSLRISHFISARMPAKIGHDSFALWVKTNGRPVVPMPPKSFDYMSLAFGVALPYEQCLRGQGIFQVQKSQQNWAKCHILG